MSTDHHHFDGSHIETLEQIRTAWAATADEVAELFGACSEEQFGAARGDRWTYSKNLDHLTKSAMAVAKGLGLPKLAVRMAIGKGSGKSRTLNEVQTVYKQALADGGQAGGKFVPQNVMSKSEGLENWGRCDELFRGNMAKWSEKNVDTHRMPHPLIGKLTVREMLFFTIFHTHHHLTNLKSA